MSCSGWAAVLGGDADGGTPDGDFPKKGGSRVAARRCPYRLFAVLTGAVSNLICEADNELRPLRQILTPNVMIMKRVRYAWKPRQRSRVSRCGLWEAPVEYGGHVCCGVEFSSRGCCLEVEERVFTGFSRQREQVCSEGRPRRLAAEFGHDLVGSGVKHVNDQGSEELLGRDMESVGVTPDGITQPGSRVAEFSQQCCGRGRGLVAGEDLLQGLGRCAGCDGFGANECVQVAVADDLQVEVVGRSSAGEHGVQLLAGFLTSSESVHGVGGDALGSVDGGGIAEAGGGTRRSRQAVGR